MVADAALVPREFRPLVAAARQEGTSISAWMTAAARRALLVRDGLQAVAEWEEEHGEFTDVELDAACRRVADEGAAFVALRPT